MDKVEYRNYRIKTTAGTFKQKELVYHWSRLREKALPDKGTEK